MITTAFASLSLSVRVNKSPPLGSNPPTLCPSGIQRDSGISEAISNHSISWSNLKGLQDLSPRSSFEKEPESQERYLTFFGILTRMQ